MPHIGNKMKNINFKKQTNKQIKKPHQLKSELEGQASQEARNQIWS